ncbi:MAG TPA: prepilin-type N-terminal cleavage/methylation domain-containing protein [Candidatus Saccharimonadales bacterium]|nr:prepilin-type N-terminal cleavage/methylation domain-containing protein [Candidatus Saccharimonadales bacterium]
MFTLRKQTGFTIVELLIVIVVIGILAAITIVAYNGIRQRAVEASLQASLKNASTKLAVYHAENGEYPSAINDCPTPAATNLCLDPGNDVSYSYQVNATGSAQMYNLIATSGTQSYNTNSDGALGASGDNLLATDPGEKTGGNEFLRYADLAPIIDTWGLVQYTISFDIKSADISVDNSTQVYMQNGSGAKYSIGNTNIPVTTSYVRHSVTVTPTVSNAGMTESYLSFYGTYSTGNVSTVKNVKVELGSVATE